MLELLAFKNITTKPKTYPLPLQKKTQRLKIAMLAHVITHDACDEPK